MLRYGSVDGFHNAKAGLCFTWKREMKKQNTFDRQQFNVLVGYRSVINPVFVSFKINTHGASIFQTAPLCRDGCFPLSSVRANVELHEPLPPNKLFGNKKAIINHSQCLDLRGTVALENTTRNNWDDGCSLLCTTAQITALHNAELWPGYLNEASPARETVTVLFKPMFTGYAQHPQRILPFNGEWWFCILASNYSSVLSAFTV